MTFFAQNRLYVTGSQPTYPHRANEKGLVLVWNKLDSVYSHHLQQRPISQFPGWMSPRSLFAPSGLYFTYRILLFHLEHISKNIGKVSWGNIILRLSGVKLRVQGQLGLRREFQDSWGYTEKASLAKLKEQQQQKKQTKKNNLISYPLETPLINISRNLSLLFFNVTNIC